MFLKATEDEMNIDSIRLNGGAGMNGCRSGTKWPFAAMKVGDAIEIKMGEYGPQNPQSYVSTYSFKVGKKFRTRKIAENTWRIWRIE